ncbi:MAG: thioredoxin family protein [Pseudomonadota bacterium]
MLTQDTHPMGWKAEAFTLPDCDGNQHSLDSLMGEKGLVLVFMCNHCPYVVAVADRLAADARTLMDEGFGVAGINANDFIAYPEDSPAKMKLYAEKWALPFPYLVDEAQHVAKSYGAVCTPDPFGFSAAGELQYRGRLDDARRGDASGRTPELVNAMRMIGETSSGPAEQFASMGCSIKWSR